jgi:CRISPR-associated protein Csb2
MMFTSVTTSKTESSTSLGIHVCFLTDRYVAAQADHRERPEWPPHPGRLFMALAAAFFETDDIEEEKAAERSALEWLEGLTAPRIISVDKKERSPITCYVPVNDRPSPNTAMLQSAPGIPRSRQSRTFPTVIPQRKPTLGGTEADVTFVWTAPISETERHFPALNRLCRSVIRLGHSSSLVMVWAEAMSSNTEGDAYKQVYEPTNAMTKTSCRIATQGELMRLKTACRADEIERFGNLKIEIDSTTGKSQKEAKARFEREFGQKYKTSLRAPEPIPASLGVWQGYRCISSDTQSEFQPVHINEYFEQDLIILAKLDGPSLSIERTLGLTQALRSAAISCSGPSTVPAWLSGHDTNHRPTEEAHAAFLTLPFAGYPHADGHIMGLAIALPRGISPEERGRWLAPLFVDTETGEVESHSIRLWGQDLPDWSIQLEDRLSPPLMLKNATWTGPEQSWASVTPVVLDRFPKSSRIKDRKLWQQEVKEIISLACTRAGMPKPLDIEVGSTAWHRGIPRAWTKTRRLKPSPSENHYAQLGDGFPPLPGKASRPEKPQVHVRIQFEDLVAGPVLLGAGRFLGYGLCLPITEQESTT